MRKTLSASVLVLALCGSAFAGDITNPPIAPNNIPAPPSVSRSTGEETGDGWGGTVAPADEGIARSDSAGNLAAIALTILDSVLALF